MITRFYVDNYKCLVNFEYKPKPFELIIGANGSGKTTVFEALNALRNFISGDTVAECFPTSSLTRWQTRDEQTFNIECLTSDGDGAVGKEAFFYQLTIKHDRARKSSRVVSEILMTLSGALLDFQQDYVVLFDDNYSKAASFPADSNRSALGNVPERPDNHLLIAFRQYLQDVLITHINPMQMSYASEDETSEAKPDFSNFASWYRHHSQETPEVLPLLNSNLQAILEGFSTLQLTKTGSDRRELMFKSTNGGAGSYRFDELSDGQRALIVLYSIAHFIVGQGKVICIDEPENFVALRELQPFLNTLNNNQRENSGQILLISHSREFINLLSDEGKCVRFYREDNGHTRIANFNPNLAENGLTGGEIVARGWEDDAK